LGSLAIIAGLVWGLSRQITTPSAKHS